MNKKRLIGYLFVMVSAGCIHAQEKKVSAQEYKLWYDRPAQVWTEALPLGNGRLGAMVYGTPGTEQIQLNEESIWAGRPNNNANPDALEYIPKVRELVFAGKYLEAQTLATEKVMAKTNSGMPYQSFGDLRIAFPGHTRYSNYYRELSLDSARAIVRYEVDGVQYQRETITSFTDQVVMVRLTANRPGQITFNAQLTSPHQDVMIASEEGNCVTLSGVSSLHEGLKGKVEFQGRLTAKNKGGKIACADGVLSVEGADEATVYVSIATNFNNYQDITGNQTERAKNYLAKAMVHPFIESKKNHVDFYRQYLTRVSLDLGRDQYANVTTDKRVENFKNTNDTHLVATYFQFGRYLLICSSQPGGQPANLQGIWNDKLFPSWDSKYTCNINLEMNYWPSEVTNLSELNEPLFRLIKEVSNTGKETAKIMYGANGWVLHHNTDIWRITGAVDKAPSGMWPSGGAWLCRHLWERYLYTGDVEFLRSVYPILKESGRFFDEIMVKEPVHNWLVVCPSNSPENVHSGSNGKATTAAGCTMDNQLIFDLWTAIISASQILDTDQEFASHLTQRLKEMAPMQVGHWGQLQEWMFDWDDPKDVHRHISHLYGLFPSNQISPYRTPELFDAAVLIAPMLEILYGGLPENTAMSITRAATLMGRSEKYILGRGAFDGTYDYEHSSISSEPRYAYLHDIQLHDRNYQTYGGTYAWLTAAVKAADKAVKNADRYSTPTLLFQAERDNTVGASGQNAFADRASNVRLIQVLGAKHSIQLSENPILIPFMDQVMDFYEEHLKKYGKLYRNYKPDIKPYFNG